MPSFGFIGPGYQSRGKVGDVERWVNMYVERIESGMGAARPTAFQALPTPGKAFLANLSGGPIAAVASSQNPDFGPSSGPHFFAVAGNTLYAVTVNTTVPVPTATSTVIGTVESSVIPNTGGQLFPVTLIVLSPVQIFILCPTGNAFLAGFGGAITSFGVNSQGVGYAPGDTGALLGGLIDAVYTISTVNGSGGVTGFSLLGGTGYSPTINAQTQTGGPQPGSGTGFSLDIVTVAANAWLVNEINGSPLAPALTIGTFIQSATFLDGYIIIGLAPSDPGSGERRKFFISGLNDPNLWNPLDFAEKEASPDPIVAVYAAFEILNVFGNATGELWQNTGNNLFPFQRLPGGGVIQTGLASPWAITTAPNFIAWLGIDGRGQYTAWIMQGSTPIRISNHAIENHWASFSTSDGANLYSYTENGHTFLVFNFPINDETWVYDTSIGGANGWHERASWDGSAFHADLARYHAFNFSETSGYPLHVVGDYSTGNLYLQGMQFLNENCNNIRRIRVSPHVVSEKIWQFVPRFRLHCLTGRVPEGSNPLFNLRISKDGGQTFGSYLTMPAGKIGEYSKLVDWYIRVRARDLVLEWSTSEQIDIVLVEGYLEGAYEGTG